MMKCSVLWCPDVNSAFLSYQHKNRPEAEFQIPNEQMMWKEDLFAIHFPYMMESQLERIHREKETEDGPNSVPSMTSAQRKRKRKENNRRPLPLDEEQNAVLITSALTTVVERARNLEILLKAACSLHLSDNNKCATAAANAPGCGSLFHLMFQENENPYFGHCSNLKLDSGEPMNLSVLDVLGRRVTNVSDTSLPIKIDGHKFFVPAQASFLTSSFHHFVSVGYFYLTVEPGYDLIVIDPPWGNKSVKRKKCYHTLTESELIDIPMDQLCAQGALVCVWITNNSKLIEFVKDMLLPAWSVRYLATWMWVKVTSSGEPVCDLYSAHKKPYEQIIIGRFEGKTCQDPCLSHIKTKDLHQENTICSSNVSSKNLTAIPYSKPHATNVHHSTINNNINSKSCAKIGDKISRNIACSAGDSANKNTSSVPAGGESKNVVQEPAGTPGDLAEVPDKFMLVSVPCALHSKKPILIDVLQPFLPSKPHCLELFARNLVPCWTSWGDEPLCHQHVDFMEPSSVPD